MFRSVLRLGSVTTIAAFLGGSAVLAQDEVFRAFDTPVPVGADWSQTIAVSAISPTDVWAVGSWQGRSSGVAEHYTLTLHYDGREWQIVDSPSPGRNYAGGVHCTLYDVDAFAPDDVWAVGVYMHETASGSETLVLHYDGSQWSVIDSPIATAGDGSWFDAVQVVGKDEFWAVGSWAGASNDGFAAHYESGQWTTYDTPWLVSGHHELKDLQVLPNGEIWAAGGAGGWTGHGDAYVVHFDGSTWELVSTPSFGSTDYFVAIEAFASDDVWASGNYTDVNNTSYPLFAHYDGSTWTRFDSPHWANALVGAGPDDVYGVSGGSLIHYDGSAWTQVEQLTGPTLPILFDIDFLADGTLFATGNDGVADDRIPMPAIRVPVDSLRLQIHPEQPSEGDAVELRTVYGRWQAPSVYVLTALDGSPLFLPFHRQRFDTDNASLLAGAVPPGLSGHALEMVSIGVTLDGRVALSNPATLVVQ